MEETIEQKIIRNVQGNFAIFKTQEVVGDKTLIPNIEWEDSNDIDKFFMFAKNLGAKVIYLSEGEEEDETGGDAEVGEAGEEGIILHAHPEAFTTAKVASGTTESLFEGLAIEGRGEIDDTEVFERSAAAFDVMTFYEMHQLTVFEQRNCRRGWRKR